MTVVYIDSVFVLNALMDAVLLWATAYLACVPSKRRMILPAALLGGAYAAVVFLPGFGGLAGCCGKAAVWLAMTVTAFGRERRFGRLALLFLLVSCGLLAALWPFVKKVLNPKRTATNIDAMIGTEGYVTMAVDNLNAEGKVKLGGMEWTARSADGTKIPAGTLVKVDRIEGVKAIVSPVTEEAKV